MQRSKKIPAVIQFGPGICTNLDSALSREWLETNGIGGFASSTIAGLNTRRYHALLVAATKPPLGRIVLLSKLEETLVIDGTRFDLSANEYPGAIHPEGYRYLTGFRLDPFPVFTYEVEGIEIEKTVFMVNGENSTVIEYRVRRGANSSSDLRLELAPLIAFRDYHSTTHENTSLNATVTKEPGLTGVAPYAGLPTLYIADDAGEIDVTGQWFRNFQYRVERGRGLDFAEDLFNPFVLKFDLEKRDLATVIASTQRRQAGESERLRAAEIARRKKVLAGAPPAEGFVRTLIWAADQYIVARGAEKTVIAGYPWFSDWGRDTMVALPGLALSTGRYDVARSVLLTFAKSVDQGMLPNRFPDAGEAPEFNTVDATLWFFQAVHAYLSYTGDYNFVRKNLYGALAGIIEWHVRGTRHGIKVEDSGLLNSGAPGVQLTWMDAKIGDWVVTPRQGKPVEIQSLWYNALRIMEDLSLRFGDEPARKRYDNMAALAKWSFNRLFWNEAAGCLYDVVNGGWSDGAVRPNQIFAVSLPYSMLAAERARAIVDVVKRDLLTPYGLRTLSPADSHYAAHFRGDAHSRDSAYHQGTVWPWLLGPFISAYVKIAADRALARQEAAAWLEPLHRHLSEAGLGHVSEVFDAEPPHTPGGCFAQAWSVGELLRTAVEDVYLLRTKDTEKQHTAAAPSSKAASSRAAG
jgi:predicted glycogen debranching enzyme